MWRWRERVARGLDGIHHVDNRKHLFSNVCFGHLELDNSAEAGEREG